NDEVGNGVNIGNGIRNVGNGYDVGETGDSSGVDFSSSPSSSSGSILGFDFVMYPGDSAVGDTVAGGGCSLAGST
nr:hypothetical protein [Tanacetum cinerariifolium]